MSAVYVVDAVRTPIGKYGGALSHARPDDLLAHVIRALMKRHPQLPGEAIEEVIAGAANQSGEDNRNVARMAALIAGLPVSVAGVTVNRLCASGLQSIMDAARAIHHGDGDVYIAGGTESMSRAPFVLPKQSSAFGRDAQVYDTTLGWRFTNPELARHYHPFSMGETAENVARQWQISRQAQDQFALDSQEKYARAAAAHRFADELISMIVQVGRQGLEVAVDEHPRQTTLEQLAKLKPAFATDGTVTAGNSSGINDGASALLLASESALNRYQLNPLARVVSMAVAGVDPAIMGVGPIPATQKALQRAGLTIADLDLIELNEAFAAQAIACIHDLGLDMDKVNVNGGAIALGHPLGCSGARISTTLIHEMKKREARYGLATMCVGVGQGAAVIYERV